MAKQAQLEVMAFPETETSKLVGVSRWKLREWAGDLYRPHYTAGFYTFRDLVSLRTLAALRTKTTKTELVRVGNHLRKNYTTPWSSLRCGIGPHRRIYFADPETGRWLSADDAEQQITPAALEEIGAKLERDVRLSRRRTRRRSANSPKLAGVAETSYA